MKTILALNGSASPGSSNLLLIRLFAEQTAHAVRTNILEDLKVLPPFDPIASAENPPSSILDLREQIRQADGVLICSPEYVFSIPSCLKNALEWCVATTVFDQKPVALITASAHGAKGHEETQLILRTLGAVLTEETLLLISGIRGKFSDTGILTDPDTLRTVRQLQEAFLKRLH